MKLRLISEIQRKTTTTSMGRANVVGTYGVGSINDFFDAPEENTKLTKEKDDEKDDEENNS